MKDFGKALMYVVVFLLFQMMGGGIVKAVWKIIYGAGAEMDDMGIIVATVLSSALTIGVLLWLRWAEVSRHWVRTRPWAVLSWCVLAALGAIMPSAFLQEHLPELPNIVEQEMDMIMQNRWGYLAVGLMAPLAEELVFRGAALRSMLRGGLNPWCAIAVSAMLFAAAHLNPAQMPHAFLIGLLLGWMYWRTDSIVPGVVFHWVNNTVAYVLYNLYPDPNLKLADYFGGNQQTVLLAVGFSLCILLPSLFQLNLRMRK